MAHCLPVATKIALLNCGTYMGKHFAPLPDIQKLLIVLPLVLMDSSSPVAAVTKLLSCGTHSLGKNFALLPDIQAPSIVSPLVPMDNLLPVAMMITLSGFGTHIRDKRFARYKWSLMLLRY